MKNKNKNTVYIIGAGPGSIDLLTVKAKELLTDYAEVVIHDRLISKEVIDLIPKRVEKIFAGKEPELHHMKQDEINEVLVEKASQGKKVVRLKGGDPFIFGRGGEEAEYLSKNNIKYEIVPGISAAIGAAAECILPLTYRNISDGVIFITGHNNKDESPVLDYKFLAKTKYTICIYMGIKNIDIISKNLIKNGKNSNCKCLVVANSTNKNSQMLYSDLKDLAKKIRQKNIRNPAIIYIGDVVKMSQKLS